MILFILMVEWSETVEFMFKIKKSNLFFNLATNSMHTANV